MAEKYGWCQYEPIIEYKDEEGKEYCVFHAPKGNKGCNIKEFNDKIFKKIKDIKKCSLAGTIFEGDIAFNSSNLGYFVDEIDFEFTIFYGRVSFDCVRFSGKVDFTKAKFYKDVHFGNIVFSGEAYFLFTRFMQENRFYRVIFEQRADFAWANFGILSEFIDILFNQNAEADFSESVFNGKTLFKQVEFKRTTNFQSALFMKNSYFNGITFFDEANWRQIIIEQAIRFEEVNLSKVSFLDTDLRKIDFINCTWPKRNGRDALYDEIRLYKNLKDNLKLENGIDKIKRILALDKASLGKIEKLYRQLKQKYKDEHDEQQASNWHYCEKEMFRKGNLRRRFFGLTALYWLSSGYGERVFRSALCLVLLVFGFLPLLQAYGGLIPTGKGQPDLINIKGFYDAFNFKNYQAMILNTLQFATFQKVTYFKPASHIGEWFKVLTQILIPLQTALFAFAVRNRFRR